MGGYVGIPTSYTPVEYIESTGTQYIDLGISVQAAGGIHAKLDILFSNFTNLQQITGVYNGETQRYNLRATTAGVILTHCTGTSGDKLITGPTATANTRYLIEAKLMNGSQFLKVNDTTYGTKSLTGLTFPNNININLLAIYDVNNGIVGYTSGKLYGAKYYNSSGELIRDFIPTIDQDNVACLYEQVEGRLYYNKGTGNFTAGNTTGQAVSIGSKARKIAKAYVGIPFSYTPVEYIESSGTQYIDTEYKPNGNTKYELAAGTVSSAGVMFGAYNSTWTDGSGFYSNAGNSSDWVHYYSNTNTQYTMSGNYNLVIDKGKVTINNTQYLNQSTKSFSVTRNLYIFTGNKAGSLTQPTSYKMYSMKIYDNDTLVRDFIPVIDQDNVACLYEQVEGRLYYNKGTGSFTAGSGPGHTVSLGNKARKIKKGYVEINSVARLIFNTYTPVEYIESSGTQYIDTNVVYDYATTQFEIDFQYLASDSNGYISVTWSGSSRDAYILGSSGTSYVLCGTAQSGSWTDIASKNTNRHKITYNNASHQIVYDGSIISGKTTVNVNGGVTMKIFCGPSVSNNPAKARIYGYKITNIVTGDVIRSFIPALDLNGTPCLYDEISDRFFYNLGTGTFNYGTLSSANTLNTAQLMNTSLTSGNESGNNLLLGNISGDDKLTDKDVGEIEADKTKIQNNASGDTINFER